MRMKNITFLILIFSSLTFAQITMQPYHWSLRYVDYLKQAGFLNRLDFINRPIDRWQLSQMLDSLPEPSSPVIRNMFSILKNEFRNEKVVPLNTKPNHLVLGFNGFTTSQVDSSSKPGFDFQFNPYLLFVFSPNLFAYGNLKLFKKAPENYLGKTFVGLHAYMEQAYLYYRSKYLDFKLGRDFLQLGPGRTGQLLFSDNSRTFDLYHIRLHHQFLSFAFFGISLDKRLSTTTNDHSPKVAYRFINGQRLSFNFKNRYFLGLSEVVLYGGPNRNWELPFMNPINFYYATTSNGPFMEANFLYNLDWDFYLWSNFNFYGELLIDDYQIEKKTAGDLEPNEIGLLSGFNWHIPFLPDARFNAEYVQIRNRTYNAPILDWQKYIHRNRVIGYYLGNDLKLWYASFEKWWGATLQTKIHFTFLKKGEGSVLGEFNKDYLNYTIEQGYDEPFPWGIVEKNWQIGLEGFYYLNQWLNMAVQLNYDQFKNYQHIKGNAKEDINVQIKIFYQMGKTLF